MKTFLKFNLIIALLVGVLLLNSCKKKVEKETLISVTSSGYIAEESRGLCVNEWFPHEQTPNPKEGKGSPFDVSSSTNGIFHQWSWQKFLWLTKPTYEIEKLMVKVNEKEQPLYIREKLPFFLNPNNLTQVSSHMKDIPQKNGASVVLTAKHQAGKEEAVLVTNPNYNEEHVSKTVFYSIHVDPIMKNAAEKFKDSILNKTLKKDNLSSFPVGSLELKVSWIDTKAIAKDKLKNYFTTVAAISKAKGEPYINTEVALLGMHVVGIVENHPEFIWATFEHDDIAPNYNWNTNKASSDTEKLLFAKGVTTGIAGIKFDTKNKEAKEKFKAFDLFQYGVPRDSTGAFMKTAQSEPLNFNNIEKINSCVKENLKDVWKNYFYNGSIWMDTDGYNKEQQAQILVGLRGAIVNSDNLSFARGSLNCANVTMETFTQTFQSDIKKINVGTLANCFSCHNAAGYPSIGGSPLYMSHIFDSYVKGEEGMSPSKIELLKQKQEVLEFMRANLN